MRGYINKRREQPRKRAGMRGLKWLCNPSVLRILILLGRGLFELAKLVNELIKFFRG